ncbi:MAG: isochorismatase family protein, partial [Caulobacteraceae bacterium]
MNAPAQSMEATGDLVGWLDPCRTALLIIDMQVDFASPAGALAKTGADLADLPAALAAAARLAEAARRVGAPVVFVGLETRAATDSAAWIERVRRRGGLPDAELALCRFRTPGADFYGPSPAEGDVMIAKARYSGFFRTSL